MVITLIEKYLKEQKANGLKPNTLQQNQIYLSKANDWKPINQWTKDDATAYILKLGEEYKRSSIEIQKAMIKKYFKWLGKPEVVAHLKTKMPKGCLKPDDILTPDDITLLIENTPSTLYKALIAFLFESGARINEALAVRVKDIKETDKGMIISVRTFKTGEDYRPSIYPFSAQYIRNHITYNALNPEDKLFNISDVTAWEMLKKIGKKAGITKPISPHKFRHAQATDMVLRGYHPSIINKKLGWTDDSRMFARYTHLSNDDVINATLENGGKPIERKPITNIKQAERISIAEASMQFSKLTEENASLQAQLKEQKEQNDFILKVMKDKGLI